jgi:hypothetical protein
MSDLKSPLAIWLKGGLFLALGTASAVLLAVSIWAFCRAYYFAFYVIEHYLNPNYRFSGLISVVRFLAGRRMDTK